MRKEFKTWAELRDFVIAFNEENNNRYSSVKTRLTGTVVFSNASPWTRHDYDEIARTYRFDNTDKYWYSECLGSSLWATCEDDGHEHIRLDWYIRDWIVERCWVEV